MIPMFLAQVRRWAMTPLIYRKSEKDFEGRKLSSTLDMWSLKDPNWKGLKLSKGSAIGIWKLLSCKLYPETMSIKRHGLKTKLCGTLIF